MNTSRTYAVNNLNQYLAAGAASFTYDANGNLASATAPDQTGNPQTTTYVYDVENRLVGRNDGSTGAALRYDPLGRLYEVIGTTGAVTTSSTRFLNDGDALVAEYSATGTLLRRYVHGADAAADDPQIWFEGGGTATADARFLYADAQGSIVLKTDSDGNIAAAGLGINAYDEYGIPAAANQGRFQYTGQAWVPELGMYYYKARMYSPTLGRFMQTDPIGYADGMNWYTYAGADPVNGVDPSGMTYVEGEGWTITGQRLGCDAPGAQCPNPLPPLGLLGVALSGGSREPGGDRGGPSADEPQKPQCPLVTPGGNFRLGPNADPRFAPEFASVLSSAFAQLNAKGITPYITSGFRTSGDQARMRGGASGSNPAASVSNHQLGLSIDLNTRTSDFPTIRAVLTGAGLTWGGNFRSKDPPHFQLPPAGTRADRAQAAICEAENGR